MTAKSKFTGNEVTDIERMIEDGMVFEMSSRIQVPSGGGVGNWLVRTGNKRIKILERQVTSNGFDLDYQVIGGVTVSLTGTPVQTNNRNTGDAIESQVSVSHTATYSGGNGIAPVYMPGSEGQAQRSNGQFNQDGFIRILEPHTDYAAEVTNNAPNSPGSAPATVDLYIMWAELTDPYPQR